MHVSKTPSHRNAAVKRVRQWLILCHCDAVHLRDAAPVRHSLWLAAGAHHRQNDGQDAGEHAEDEDRDARDQQQLLAGGLGPEVGLHTRPEYMSATYFQSYKSGRLHKHCLRPHENHVQSMAANRADAKSMASSGLHAISPGAGRVRCMGLCRQAQTLWRF